MSEFRPIDAHVHFLDPERPEGLVWPPRHSALHRRWMPEQLAAAANELFPIDCILVESGDRPSDDAWMLRLAAEQPAILGVVLNLQGASAGLAARIQRAAGSVKARGIRLRPISRFDLTSSLLARNLALLGPADMTLEVGAPTVATLRDYTKLARRIPNVTCLLDHLGYPVIDGRRPDPEWRKAVFEFAALPNTYCKLTGILQFVAQQPPPQDPSYYRPVLDYLWHAFGEERLIYGSNWPALTLAGDYETNLGVYRSYLDQRSPAATRFFRDNAVEAYGLN